MKTICSNCKKDIDIPPFRIKRAKNVFCSNFCSHSFVKLPVEEIKKRKKLIDINYRISHKEEIKNYREINKEHISEKQKINYIKNKDKIKKQSSSRYYNVIKKNPVLISQMNERTSRFIVARIKKDKEFKNKLIEKNKKKQKETLEFAENRKELWTDTDLMFVKENYKTMNAVDIAIKLGRTYQGIMKTVQIYKLGLKLPRKYNHEN